jgi:hypothetical protein
MDSFLTDHLPGTGDGELKKRAPPRVGDERVVRGTTPLR